MQIVITAFFTSFERVPQRRYIFGIPYRDQNHPDNDIMFLWLLS